VTSLSLTTKAYISIYLGLLTATHVTQQLYSVGIIQQQERGVSHYCLMYSYADVYILCTQHACVLYLHVITYELLHCYIYSGLRPAQCTVAALACACVYACVIGC
jgi:hypothetical protein